MQMVNLFSFFIREKVAVIQFTCKKKFHIHKMARTFMNNPYLFNLYSKNVLLCIVSLKYLANRRL